MIYLDNAATTLHKPKQVIEAMVNAMTSMGNAARGAHGGSLGAARSVYDTRCKIAKLFNLKRAERVIFTQNSTEALNIAINGIFNEGDHVITSDLEHNSVLRPLYRLEKEGRITLSFARADKKGNVKAEDFASLIKENTRSIVLNHASNLTGNVVDIEKIGRIAKENELIFIVDASQSAGVIDIDMEKMNIDILCFTGHKSLMGAQGTGGMCIREGIDIRPLKVGGSGVHSFDKEQPNDYPTRLEAGTLNSHGIAALNAAIDYINKVGMENIRKREHELMLRFYRGVKDIENVTVYGDFETDLRCAIVALNIADEDSSRVSDILYENYDIATRAGAHCAPRMHEALGTKEQGAVRFSFSYFNTEEEVDTAIKAVYEIAQ